MDKKLKKLFQKNKKKVDFEIESFLPKSLDKTWLNHILGQASFDYDEITCSEAISKPIWNLLNRGGKRWRPILMKFAYHLVGGKGNIDKFLIIPELIHNGTLIIDDIEDNSDVRRGLPCIHKLFGEDISINAGNTLYYLPLNLVMKSNLNCELKNKIYETINSEMINISFGQGMDIYWHKNAKISVTEKQYLQMCAYKTGTLARMSAKLGAILGKANDKQIIALGRFAESIGVAFQIQDDILNITNKKSGKDFGGDISEGKKSLVVIKTLERANKEDKKDLIKILNLQTKDKILINKAISIIKKYDAINYAQDIARSLIKDAWREIDVIFKDSATKNQLKLFADYLIEREI